MKKTLMTVVLGFALAGVTDAQVYTCLLYTSDIGQLGEFGLIDHLASKFTLQRRDTLKGIGDDAAVLDYGGRCV